MPYFFHKMRIWDLTASTRVDRFIANSEHVAARIAKYYRRSSTVICPGIDEKFYTLGDESQRGDFYLAVGRMIPYKRFDLLVAAFNQNGLPLVIVTSTRTRLTRELMAISRPNITWCLDISHEEKLSYMQRARAFMFPQEEDFGMVPIEAMLCGTPVITFARGGALETVTDKVSGVFFDEQTAESIA